MYGARVLGLSRTTVYAGLSELASGQIKSAPEQPEGRPEEVRVYDFIDPDFGKVAPYGVCDLRTNTGWAGVDEKTYEAGIKVTDEESALLSIERDSSMGNGMIG